MQDHCIIPADHPIGQHFRAAVRNKKVVFVAGLPSSGKSLMLQQLAILADQQGRALHTMQWDAVRRSFETDLWLRAYPEVDDLTHPGIRKAVGLWVRTAIANWISEHRADTDILIAELPVVGGRLSELLQPMDDPAEAALSSSDVHFFVPVPTDDMRKVITGYRAQTFANPRNEQETKDAPIHIVEADWYAARQLHNRWQGIANDDTKDHLYSADIYRHVFERLLRFRNADILSVDRSFETQGSAYDRDAAVTELKASAAEVEATFAQLQKAFPGQSVVAAVETWADY